MIGWLRGAKPRGERGPDSHQLTRHVPSSQQEHLSNLLMDNGAFGEHQRASTGIFDFLGKLLPHDAYINSVDVLDKPCSRAMIAWRQGKAAEAMAPLEPIREGDALARYAYVSALLDLKRTQEGAAELRALAEEALGTSIVLLALDRLSKGLGQDVILTSQPSKEIGDRAAAMEAGLGRSLSTTLDPVVENPVRSVVVDLRSTATSVKPRDPLTLTMRLRNHSQLPLAIGQDSSIAGKVMLRTQVARAGEASSPDLPPQPTLIDRRLRLMPGDELTVDVDAELTTVGLTLKLSPLDAHALRVSVVTNPASATGGMAPGFPGTVTSAPPLMSTGVRGWR
jgi:hypothetical protein